MKSALTKKLLLILGVLIVVVIGLVIWLYSQDKMPKRFGWPTELKNESPIIVGTLKDEKEQALGTIIYSAVKITSELQKTATVNKVTLESPDSLKGVIGIYSQDLLNRYPNYTVTEKEIIKDDALEGKAIVLTCSGPKGNLTITAWPNKNGMTSIVIEKDSSF